MAPRTQHWLMKTEPGDFSIDDLERVGTEPWTGVRNVTARNFMRSMRVGDGVLFYHSSTKVPGIYGIAEVASAPYPDPTQFDPASHYHDPRSTPEVPRWTLVDVRYVRTLEQPVTLEEIRRHTAKLGDDFALTRKGNRLSVLPVSARQWKLLLSLG
jgi:predicted RNA-binding protein with PUA-like domain